MDINEVKKMDIKEFVDGGYLLEVNRLFFHPLGLALSVNVDDSGKYSIDGVLDSRDDPEGFVFDKLEAKDFAKIEKINKEHLARCAERLDRLGYVIQPVPNVVEEAPPA